MYNQKNHWGPPKWEELHLCAINYSRYPKKEDIIEKEHEIWKIINALPCQKCRGHAIEYIKFNPPYLRNSQRLQIWVWSFHNNVNQRLGKEYFSYPEYEKKYEKFTARAFHRV